MCSILNALELEKFEWNFFATSHGKGAVDGIGGSVKRMVWRKVRSRKAEAAFVEVAKSCTGTAITTKLITKQDIIKVKEDEMWQDVETVPGTKSFHQITADEGTGVLIKCKQYAESKSTFYFDLLSGKNQNTSASETVEIESENESGDETGREIQMSDLKVGDWVKVVYDGKEYPGEVCVHGENDVQVSVMLRKFAGFFKWPAKEDKCFYPVSAVIAKISAPEPVGTRGQFKFKEIM